VGDPPSPRIPPIYDILTVKRGDNNKCIGLKNFWKIFGKNGYLCLKNGIMKKIIRLTESDLTKIVKRVIKEHENTIYNYFKIVGEDGEVYGVGGVEKGSKNEVYFIDEIFNLGFTPVKISQEEYESYDDGDEIRNF
jgi:hypothetical protein